MGRVFRSNVRRVLGLVGVVDEQSRDLAATMAVYSNTASPANRGTHWNNQGLPGTGVNQYDGLTDPIQHFSGVDVRTINGASINRSGGDIGAGMLPSANGGALAASNPLAWMSLGNAVGVGYGS